MRKKLLLLILSIVSCVCLAFGLSACGGSGDSTSDWANGIFTVETAYAEAQELGYSGTLEEFISSISGENGLGISSVSLNDNGELVVAFTDSSEINLGVIKGADGKDGVGIASAEVNSNGELILTLTDGQEVNCGVVAGTDGTNGTNGTNGTDGVGIASAAINSNGELVITLTNGQNVTCGTVVGAAGAAGTNGTNGTDGEDGVGIGSIEINSDGELVITLSDGQEVNCGLVAGSAGTDGADGADGADGKDGEDGADGVGIDSIEINSNGELVVTLTDGTATNLGVISGGDYVAAKVTLTFDLGYDTTETIESIQLTKGDSVDLPVPERDGYAFIGWYYGTGANAGQVTDVTPISRDMTLTAQWEKVYSIELTDVPSNVLINNEAWFYGYYEGGFTSNGNDIITINIISDGETYTAAQALNLGLINNYYSWCWTSGEFDAFVSFAVGGEYTIQVVYGNSSAEFDVTASNFYYSSTPSSEIYANEWIYFNMYYYGSSSYDYPVITITNTDGYEQICEVTDGGTYSNYYDDNGASNFYWNGDIRLSGDMGFYVAGEYTVTITYGEDSTSFNVTVKELPAYISYVGSRASYWYEADNGTAIELDLDVVAGYDIYLEIYAENPVITVTLDGVELTAAEVTYLYEEGETEWYAYTIADGGDYYVISYSDNMHYIYIYSSLLTEGVTSTAVVTAEADNGTATATLNLTLSNWYWSQIPSSEIYGGEGIIFSVYYYGSSSCDYPLITITNTDGYEYTYEITNSDDYTNYYEDSNTTYCGVRWYGTVRTRGDIYFYVAGEYTVTITYGEDSASFNVTVSEYPFDGEIYSQYIWSGIYGELSDGSELVEYDMQSDTLEFFFYAPNTSTVTVTIDGDKVSKEYYNILHYTSNRYEVYLFPATFLEIGSHEITVTVAKDGYGSASLSLTVTLQETPTYFSFVSYGNTGCSYSVDNGIEVVENPSIPANINGTILLEAYAVNAEVLVTLDGTDLTLDEDYYIEQYDSWYDVYIYTSVLTLDADNVVVITVTGDNGTATATLDLTLVIWENNNEVTSEGVTANGYYDLSLVYYGTSDEDVMLTITSTEGYACSYMLVEEFYSASDGLGYTYIEYTINTYNEGTFTQRIIYGTITFLVEGDYTITAECGSDSIVLVEP